ncbi:hypothetical protein Bca101_043770 [Brassica carinata]
MTFLLVGLRRSVETYSRLLVCLTTLLILLFCFAGRHPCTIAYPENFFESAQRIATHSHLRWPDVSREWIRRRQARIARVDWESKYPLEVGTRKSRLTLFTRKQQKILRKAKKMSGIPDLSALLEGKLRLLKKPARTGGADSAEGNNSNPADVDALASQPVKEKAREEIERNEALLPEELAPEGGSVPSGGSSGSSKKKKKREEKKKRKRPRGKPDGAESEERSRKKAKDGETDEVQQSPGPESNPVDVQELLHEEGVIEGRGEPAGASLENAQGASDRAASPTRDTRVSPPRVSVSEGSLGKRTRIEFADHVEFRYDEATPLVGNPDRCAELTRQIRGGPRELPPVEDLFFKDDYIRSALANRRVSKSREFIGASSRLTYAPPSIMLTSCFCGFQADGCMNVLVEKYDTTLKQTMVELGASTKLAKTRLGVIERLRAESKKVSEKTLEEKEILKAKFEDLEAKLVADRAAKRELEKAKVVLEKENARLRAERNAAVEKLAEERKRLRDSRSLEVTRERVRVQSAMTEKFGRCIGRVTTLLVASNPKEQNLSGQASGTRKCLEMIRNEGLGITQELIDVFIEQERVHNAAVAKLAVGDLPEEDLVLSPLVLPNPFLNEEFIAALDPYGSNDGLVGSETASLLRESSDIPEGGSTGQSSEVPATVTPLGNASDLNLEGEVAEKNDGVEIEVPTMEREELEPTAERSASDVIPNEVPKDAAADGAQDPSVSGEALA